MGLGSSKLNKGGFLMHSCHEANKSNENNEAN